ALLVLVGLFSSFVLSGQAFECPALEMRDTPRAPLYSESLLWEISGPAAQRSVVFGTMHLAADKIAQPTPAVTAALLRNKQFGMEVVMDFATLLQISEQMRFPDTTTLSSIIGAELFARASELMQRYGVDANTTEQLKPWAVYTTLSLPPGEFSTPLDMVLLQTAQHTNKIVFGLETLAEQTAVFESIATAQQIALVTEVVCHYALLHAMTEDLIVRYRRGDLAGLYRHAHRVRSPAQEALNERLLVERNRRMAERMQPHLEVGDAFIAIGALHLPGADGVLARLAARGYRVRPLPDR
ncbi:MAG: TraB/GumN family protein, partial [Gammaproteobacteria bacterium]